MNLQRCPDCPALYRCVPGDGPEPARVLFIGGSPGTEEDRPVPMFSGKSGKEFNETYLRLAGLDRDEIRITNSRKCRAEKQGKVDPADTFSCAAFHLPDEIDSCSPEVIVLMGAAACSLIPDINLGVEHGIPRYETLFGWTGTIVPMDHPSGGMHDTSMMIPLLEDFARLRHILDGSYTFPQNRTVAVYSYVRTAQEIVDSISVPMHPISIDMEDHAGVPFSIQWCSEPGRAYMMRISDVVVDAASWRLKGIHHVSMLSTLETELTCFASALILHNAPGDLDAFDRLKIRLRTTMPIRDTMQEAYHQGNLPQGLKALAYRLLGVRMRSWEEVVGPPSRKAVLDWVESAIEAAALKLTITTFEQLKTKVKKVVKAHPVEKRLRAILRYGCYNDEYPIWKHLEELRTTDPAFLSVESTLGHVPQMGIGNCTAEEALEYACKDADMTLRVAGILDKLRDIPRNEVYIGDRDVIAKGE